MKIEEKQLAQKQDGEIIRCAECRYMQQANVNKKGFLICPASGMEITDDDFCSYAEHADPKDKTDFVAVKAQPRV